MAPLLVRVTRFACRPLRCAAASSPACAMATLAVVFAGTHSPSKSHNQPHQTCHTGHVRHMQYLADTSQPAKHTRPIRYGTSLFGVWGIALQSSWETTDGKSNEFNPVTEFLDPNVTECVTNACSVLFVCSRGAHPPFNSMLDIIFSLSVQCMLRSNRALSFSL